MSKTPDSTLSISGAEWEVMKIIWEQGPLAARDVYAALPDGKEWAIKTVKTLLSRLVAKGALEYEQIGNSYLYRSAVSREQVTREEMRGFIDRILDGSIGPLLAHFIQEHENLSDEEVEKLRELLEKKHRPRGKKER